MTTPTAFQSDLFAHARSTDPETSRGAADRATRLLTRTQERILEVLATAGKPLTDSEIENLYRSFWPQDPVTSQSLRSRRSQLRDRKRVRFANCYGESPSGGKSRKWELV